MKFLIFNGIGSVVDEVDASDEHQALAKYGAVVDLVVSRLIQLEYRAVISPGSEPIQSVSDEECGSKILARHLSSPTRVRTNEEIGGGIDVTAYFKANECEALKRLAVFMYSMGFRDGRDQLANQAIKDFGSFINKARDDSK